MRRRKFFGALAAIGAMVSLVFVQKQPSLRVCEDNAFTVRVSGSADQIAKFHDAYQTHLWPDWKTDKIDVARKQAVSCQEFSESNGYALFYSGSAINRSAIAHARSVCGC